MISCVNGYLTSKYCGSSTTIGSVRIATISYGSEWWAFPVEDLPAVQALCYDQRQRFLTDAAAIHVELEESDEDV